MKKKLSILGIISMGVFFICMVIGAKSQDVKSPDSKVLSHKTDPTLALKPDINFGKIPLYFISNRGQVHNKALFYAKTSRYTLWLTKEGLVFDSSKEVGGSRFNASTSPRQHKRDVSRLLFINANKNPEIVSLNETKLKVNYFKGNDPSKWVGNIPTSQAVLYRDLYKNIDLKVYGIEKQIEYDWIVKPEGKPEDIRFEYKNVKSTRIDKEGNLVITTKFGELIHKKPDSYQVIYEENGKMNRNQDVGAGPRTCPKERRVVAVKFKKTGKDNYGFKVGDYDKSLELIIDPVVLVYSTYLGGNDIDEGSDITIDNSGYIYICGTTKSIDFPCINPYQVDPVDVERDAFISKLDTSQSGAASLIYSTYLGGGHWDEGHNITVDNNGIAFITGKTMSTDFPSLNQYQLDPVDNDFDAFVSKIDTNQPGPSGLLYSTYLGGNSSDYGYGIEIDDTGYVYVSGATSSTDFPCLNQYQLDPADGASDAFVTKIDTTQSGTACIVYSTYLGGNNHDYGYKIKVISSSSVYLVGSTNSTDFPTLNQYQLDPADGASDAFVSKLDTTQSGTSCLVYSTYLGGNGIDGGWDLAIDQSGYVYVTGTTWSTDFPCLNQYQTYQGASDDFVTKLDTSLSGTACLLYSTYLGGTNIEAGGTLALNSNNSVYLTGQTFSTNFPTLHHYQTHQGMFDAFVSKIDTSNSGSSCLIYSTYLGGSSSEGATGIVIDSIGYVYVVGGTYSTDFPTLKQYQVDPGDSKYDAFITKLILPYVNIASPNGAEAWTLNVSQNITWTAPEVSGDLAIVLQQSEIDVALIAENVDATLGSYSWIVGVCLNGTVIAGTDYKISIKQKGSTLKDKSDASFTILDPSITVTSPNGSENWCTGTVENITWTPDGLTNPLYIILQQHDSNVALINKNIDPSLGIYAWTVGDYRLGAAVAGANYKILLKEKDSTVKDKSDASFSIIDPYIAVTSPNGGENWAMGGTRDITWNSAGLSNNLYIVVQQAGTNVALITKNINPSLGTYSWTVGDCIQGAVTVGTNYKVLIAEKGTNIKDKSDFTFAIGPY